MRVIVWALAIFASVAVTPSGANSAQPATAALTLARGDLHASLPRAGIGRALRAPIPFSMAGVSAPEHLAVALRTSWDGRTWSAWHQLESDGGGPGDPVWTDAARWLQLSLSAPGSVRVHLIDSLGLAHAAAPQRGKAVRLEQPQPQPVTAPRPSIITRAQWGADESLRKSRPRYARTVRSLVLHHTASGNHYRPDQAAAVVRGIYGYHTMVRGWNDIGYHLLVDRYGRVYEGRAGGVDQAVIGAHAGGFNVETSGVALIGDFRQRELPQPAREALVRLLAWKASVHELDPRGSSRFRSGGSSRYAHGTWVRVANLSGHRDLSATVCPGRRIYEQLPALREEVARRMPPRPPAGVRPPPSGPLPPLPVPLR